MMMTIAMIMLLAAATAAAAVDNNDDMLYVHLKNHITLNCALIVMFWLRSCCKLILKNQ